jgi:hypothetical protein
MKQALIAAHLDVSVRTLRDLIARGIVPRGGDLDASRLGYIRHLREVAANRLPLGDLDPAQEKAQLDRARRLEVEQRLAEKSRELIPAAEVASTWATAMGITRGRLLGLPSRAAGTLAGMADMRECERYLRKEFYEALEDGVDGLSLHYGITIGNERSDSAARSNGSGSLGPQPGEIEGASAGDSSRERAGARRTRRGNGTHRVEDA